MRALDASIDLKMERKQPWWLRNLGVHEATVFTPPRQRTRSIGLSVSQPWYWLNTPKPLKRQQHVGWLIPQTTEFTSSKPVGSISRFHFNHRDSERAMRVGPVKTVAGDGQPLPNVGWVERVKQVLSVGFGVDLLFLLLLFLACPRQKASKQVFSNRLFREWRKKRENLLFSGKRFHKDFQQVMPSLFSMSFSFGRHPVDEPKRAGPGWKNA